jgi:C1A family cysteine protease
MKSQNLQFYAGGIYNNCTTIVDERELDHAVLIVGFNNNIGWKMKNTWGSTWGVNGYGWITLD